MNNDIEFTAKGENDAGLQKRAMQFLHTYGYAIQISTTFTS